MIGNQISRTRGFYDELWKIIVKSKIENQAQVLELLDKSSDTVIDMRKFKENVSDGDKSNREAHGAKIYFNTLMNTSFSRGMKIYY